MRMKGKFKAQMKELFRDPAVYVWVNQSFYNKEINVQHYKLIGLLATEPDNLGPLLLSVSGTLVLADQSLLLLCPPPALLKLGQ